MLISKEIECPVCNKKFSVNINTIDKHCKFSDCDTYYDFKLNYAEIFVCYKCANSIDEVTHVKEYFDSRCIDGSKILIKDVFGDADLDYDGLKSFKKRLFKKYSCKSCHKFHYVENNYCYDCFLLIRKIDNVV